MPLVRIDGVQLRDWESFHSVFASRFGFPDFYGRNMNAWIDCMSSLDAIEDGMTSVHGSASDPVVLQLDNANVVPEELFEALVECAGFVNWRRLEMGEPAILMLSFNRAGQTAPRIKNPFRARQSLASAIRLRMIE
jgi:RNAse (barnase) inhibitor barstar